MTAGQIKTEARELAREHWWDGAGAVVVFFLLASFIWKRPDNDYLLYVALAVAGTHGYISMGCFDKRRKDRRHREEIAVAYRAHLVEVQRTQSRESYHGAQRAVAGRNGSTPQHVAKPARRFVAISAH